MGSSKIAHRHALITYWRKVMTTTPSNKSGFADLMTNHIRAKSSSRSAR